MRYNDIERTEFLGRPDKSRGDLSVFWNTDQPQILSIWNRASSPREGNFGVKFTTDERRIAKIQERLGKSVKLISDYNYLPMFRNRQINYTKEFEFSVKLSKKKRDPRKYFAFIWSSRNVAKTVDWLRKLMNLEKHEKAAERNRQRQLNQTEMSFDGLERLSTMKRKFNLIT